MRFRRLYGFTLLGLTTPAFGADPDLTVDITPPAGAFVYDTGTYSVQVSNVGNRRATSVSLEIQLPETNTSPTVHLMGALETYSTTCTLSGTRLLCSLGVLRKGRSASVAFELMLPYASSLLQVVATASTASNEPNLQNNSATHTTSLLYRDVAITAPRSAHIQHCTGTGLTSFFECTLFPSSISWTDVQMNPNGSVTFLASSDGPVTPDTTGTWFQESVQDLALRFYDSNGLFASFDGKGVEAAACFEGVTFFPDETGNVSPYQVCLR